MNTRIKTVVGALVLSATLASASAAFAQQRTSTVTTRRGSTVTTTVERDRSDGSVGAQRTVTGPSGRVAAANRSTTMHDGTVVHERSETGFSGRTTSRQDVYTKGTSSHSRTGRFGNSRSWSRKW